LETASIEGENLVCGEMTYKAVVLTDVESLTPKAAQKLEAYAAAGGKVVFIDNKPHRSLSFKNAENNDAIVSDAVENMLKSSHVFQIDGPAQTDDFIAWTEKLMEKIGLQPQVVISNPLSHLYTMKQTRGEQDVYFFTNSERKKAVTFEATFQAENKTPYLWNPATGERFALAYTKNNKLEIRLEALESALIVFEPAKLQLPTYTFKTAPKQTEELNTSWDVKFEHANGTVFNRKMDKLIDFSTSEEEELTTFSGTVTYSTQFENNGNLKCVKLGEVNEAVTELVINGKSAGMRWYGIHCYDVGELLKEGENTLEIKLTTTLANYCRSLNDNPTAERWTGRYESPFPSGLESVALAQ
jgi:hypothetical protein